MDYRDVQVHVNGPTWQVCNLDLAVESLNESVEIVIPLSVARRSRWSNPAYLCEASRRCNNLRHYFESFAGNYFQANSKTV